MNIKRTLVLTLTLYVSICVLHAAPFWLHVRVQEKGKAESVKVNVPMSLIQTVLPLIEDQAIKSGHIDIEDQHFTVPQLREIWQEIQSQGDYELASIDSNETRVRVALEGNELLVRSEEGSETQVMARVPKQFVDALLSGQGDELNISAAIGVIQTIGAQELVNITDDDTVVRVWIDASSAAE